MQIHPIGEKTHTMYYNEFLLQGIIPEPKSKIPRTTTLEFQDYFRVFQDQCLFQEFPGLEISTF